MFQRSSELMVFLDDTLEKTCEEVLYILIKTCVKLSKTRDITLSDVKKTKETTGDQILILDLVVYSG